jgi:hypothetical protein
VDTFTTTPFLPPSTTASVSHFPSSICIVSFDFQASSAGGGAPQPLPRSIRLRGAATLCPTTTALVRQRAPRREQGSNEAPPRGALATAVAVVGVSPTTQAQVEERRRRWGVVESSRRGRRAKPLAGSSRRGRRRREEAAAAPGERGRKERQLAGGAKLGHNRSGPPFHWL